MAESYVTKFTKYVAEQRNVLKSKLKAKGLSTDDNLSLGGLIAQLDGLQESYKPYKYERDEAVPDIDEMFDNDPLRKVNGGEYAGCIYGLLEVDKNGNVGLYYSNSSNGQSVSRLADKIVFSDGAEYSTQSAVLLHKVGENGIYTTKSGQKLALVKFYKIDSVLPLQYTHLESYIEMIDDFYNGWRWNNIQSITGYLAPNGNGVYVTKYYRWSPTHATTTNTSYFTFPDFLTRCDVVVLEGVTPNVSMQQNFKIGSTIIDRRELTTTSTSITYSLGPTNSAPKLGYIQLPTSSVPMTLNLYSSAVTTIIPDTEITSYSGSLSHAEKLHIGNKILSSVSFSGYYLKDVTLSENAFGLNDTAITVTFGNSTLTYESVLNIINNLADRTGKTANILKLQTIQKNMLSDEEKAILTNKNWTLS